MVCDDLAIPPEIQSAHIEPVCEIRDVHTLRRDGYKGEFPGCIILNRRDDRTCDIEDLYAGMTAGLTLKGEPDPLLSCTRVGSSRRIGVGMERTVHK